MHSLRIACNLLCYVSLKIHNKIDRTFFSFKTKSIAISSATSSTTLRAVASAVKFCVNRQVTERQNKLATLCGKLDGLSPLKVLARGYSIAENSQGKAIVSVKDVNQGDFITTQVADGKIVSKVL